MTAKSEPVAHRQRAKKWLRLALYALAFCLTLYASFRVYRVAMGDPSALLQDTWHEGTRFLDRKGHLLRELPGPGGNRGRPLSLGEIGDRMVLSTIVSEDREFYQHEGVDAFAIARAAAQNVTHQKVVSGASTITQQLVKLLDHGGKPHERGLYEKFREAARAQNLEEVVSKDTILEAYLNRLSYGRGLVGPEAAARGYFRSSSKDLSWARASYLAVLPRAPSFLDPISHPERVLVRQRMLLRALHDEGLIDAAALGRALAEPVLVLPPERPFVAPHFVESLRTKLKNTDAPKTLVTTLDVTLQSDVEGLVRTHLASIHHRNVENAALLVIDNKNGDVLAYVGSADFDNERIDGQVDMVQAKRQPGSTLKPFVYELAFERGHNAAEMLADVPTTFGNTSEHAYMPLNFNGTFEGPISAREALAGSLNVPVVRLLAEIGPNDMLLRLRDLGLNSLDRDASYYGLSLALGSGEVRLWELSQAYVALARGGSLIPLRSLSSDPEPLPRRVMPEELAASIAEILSDPLARVRGLHGQGSLDLGYPVALKTGTSAGFRDTWCAGFTHERTVVVWVGNADGSPTQDVTGGTGAGPLFADVMRRTMMDVLGRAPIFNASLLEDVEVCPLSGKPAGSACPHRAMRRLPKKKRSAEDSPHEEETCALHFRVTPVEPSHGDISWQCDPNGNQTIALLPNAFSEWLKMEPKGAPGHDPLGTLLFPKSAALGCGVRTTGPSEITVTSPAPSTVFLVSGRGKGEKQVIVARASITSSNGIPPKTIDFFLDGKPVGRSAWPYTATIVATPGEHEIVALPSDPQQQATVRSSRFKVL